MFFSFARVLLDQKLERFIGSLRKPCMEGGLEFCIDPEDHSARAVPGSDARVLSPETRE